MATTITNITYTDAWNDEIVMPAKTELTAEAIAQGAYIVDPLDMLDYSDYETEDELADELLDEPTDEPTDEPMDEPMEVEVEEGELTVHDEATNQYVEIDFTFDEDVVVSKMPVNPPPAKFTTNPDFSWKAPKVIAEPLQSSSLKRKRMSSFDRKSKRFNPSHGDNVKFPVPIKHTKNGAKLNFEKECTDNEKSLQKCKYVKQWITCPYGPTKCRFLHPGQTVKPTRNTLSPPDTRRSLPDTRRSPPDTRRSPPDT